MAHYFSTLTRALRPASIASALFRLFSEPRDEPRGRGRRSMNG